MNIFSIRGIRISQADAEVCLQEWQTGARIIMHVIDLVPEIVTAVALRTQGLEAVPEQGKITEKAKGVGKLNLKLDEEGTGQGLLAIDTKGNSNDKIYIR